MNQDNDFQGDEKQMQGQQQKPINQPNQRLRYHSFKRILLLIINISLSSFYFGYTIIYLNVIQFSTIMNVFSINMEKAKAEGFLTFCVPLGGLFGSLLSSYFIRNISRRNTILYINYAAITVGCLVFFADLKFYMILRVCQGICAGIFSAIVPLLIKETTPSELSGSFGVFQQLFITIGIFSCCFFSFLLSQIFSDPSGQTYWKLIFALPVLILIFQTIVLHFIFPYETPKYLVDNLMLEQAYRVISYIYKAQFVEEVIQQYKNESQPPTDSVSSQIKEQKQLIITKFVSIHLALLQQFVGISVVATYAGQMAVGNLQKFKPILPSIINFQQVVTAVISSFLLQKYGRKLILQLGTIGAVITNLIIAIGFGLSETLPKFSVALILIGLFLYMINFGLSLGPIVWMYIPQIVKPEFLPYSTMVNWAGSALCILLFPIIKAHLPNENPSLLFFFFFGWSLLSYIVNKAVVIQTKNKTSIEIKQEYEELQLKYWKQ